MTGIPISPRVGPLHLLSTDSKHNELVSIKLLQSRRVINHWLPQQGTKFAELALQSLSIPFTHSPYCFLISVSPPVSFPSVLEFSKYFPPTTTAGTLSSPTFLHTSFCHSTYFLTESLIHIQSNSTLSMPGSKNSSRTPSRSTTALSL
jgi:hypothetical protein